MVSISESYLYNYLKYCKICFIIKVKCFWLINNSILLYIFNLRIVTDWFQFRNKSDSIFLEIWVENSNKLWKLF